MKKENPFDSDVEEYDAWFKKNDRLFASELSALRELLPTGGRGIEIGVGTGIFASALGIGHGVEPSKNMAAVAEKRGIRVLRGAAENLPVEDGAFSYALMVTVDCFLSDVSKAFAEVHRILSEDGVLIIAFLDRNTPLGQQYEKNKHSHISYQHAHFHSAAEMAAILQAAGFEILARRQTVFSLDNVLQTVGHGSGEGVFAVFKAKRIPLGN